MNSARPARSSSAPTHVQTLEQPLDSPRGSVVVDCECAAGTGRIVADWQGVEGERVVGVALPCVVGWRWGRQGLLALPAAAAAQLLGRRSEVGSSQGHADGHVLVVGRGVLRLAVVVIVGGVIDEELAWRGLGEIRVRFAGSGHGGLHGVAFVGGRGGWTLGVEGGGVALRIGRGRVANVFWRVRAAAGGVFVGAIGGIKAEGEGFVEAVRRRVVAEGAAGVGVVVIFDVGSEVGVAVGDFCKWAVGQLGVGEVLQDLRRWQWGYRSQGGWW